IQFSASMGIMALILAARVGCTNIADDLKVGAFQFYFSRTIRPRDYVWGKLLGIMTVVAIPMLGAPFIMAVFRLLLSDTWDEAGRTAPMVWHAILYGLIGTAAYALPAAAAGAIMKKRIWAQALFAAFAFVMGLMAEGMAEALEMKNIRLLAL